MQAIVAEEITSQTEGELSALYKRVTKELTRTAYGTQERRNALVVLDYVVLELNARASVQAGADHLGAFAWNGIRIPSP